MKRIQQFLLSFSFLLFLVALLVGTAASSFVIIISIVRFIFLLLLLRQVFCVSRYFDLFATFHDEYHMNTKISVCHYF